MSKIHYDLFYNKVPETSFNKFYEVCKTLDWSKGKDFNVQGRIPNRELGALIFDYVYKNHKRIKYFTIDCMPYGDSFWLNSVAVKMQEHSMVKIVDTNIGNVEFPFEYYVEHAKVSDHSKILKAIQESIVNKVFNELWKEQQSLTKAQLVIIKQEYNKFQESGLDKYGFTIAIRFNANDGISVAIQNPYIDFRIPLALSKEEYPAFCAKETLYELQFD